MRQSAISWMIGLGLFLTTACPAPPLLADEGVTADASVAVDMSLEDLLNVEITSAARKSQRLNDVAAAVYVITREDIERSGATSIPEALRLAPGVSVARLANNRWAVSIRGFNSRFSNKLLVLMDGRSMYSQLFSGVLWEVEDTLLEDIERIEVIRGPGAAMWGANAVNGVINIITRRARDTQGNLLVAGGGSEESAFASFRHGMAVGDGHLRVWGKAFARDESVAPQGQTANDDWRAARAGFRGDWTMGSGHRMTVSGQAYYGSTDDTWLVPDIRSPWGATPNDVSQRTQGGFLLARDEWTLADGSEAAVQAYVSSGELKIPGSLSERRTTVDLDFQHRILLGERHDLIWGLGYRYSRDDISSTGMISIRPQQQSFSLASAFIQDEITLVPETLRLLFGLRLEDNSFSGFAPQPSGRVIWTPSEHQSLWASVSRAARIPSRAELGADVDGAVIPARSPINPTPLPILVRNFANRDLGDEDLLAYEMGYRHQFGRALSLDVALFYNVYDDLRGRQTGVPRLVPPPPLPYLLFPVFPDNSVRARTHGVEVAADWYPLPWWRIQPIYSYLDLRASSKTGDAASLESVATFNNSDPRHQWALRSSMSFSQRQQFDLWLRHVGKLATSGSPLYVPAYTTLDLRYAWRPTRDLELSLVGQNLLDGQHPESVASLLPSRNLEIQRGWYLKGRWQF